MPRKDGKPWDKPYTGDLQKRIDGRFTPAEWRLLDFPDARETMMRSMSHRIAQARDAKMRALAEHYGRKWPEDAALLALDLANSHVEGFKIRFPALKKTGRRKEWDNARLWRLLSTVEDLKTDLKAAGEDAADTAALAAMTTRQKYKGDWGPPAAHRGTLKQWQRTLVARLHDARTTDLTAERFKSSFTPLGLGALSGLGAFGSPPSDDPLSLAHKAFLRARQTSRA